MFLKMLRLFQNPNLSASHSGNYNRYMSYKIKKMERRISDIEVYLTIIGKMLQDVASFPNEEWKRKLERSETKKLIARVQTRGLKTLNENRNIKRFVRGTSTRSLKTPEESQLPENDEILLKAIHTDFKMSHAVFHRPNSGLTNEVLDFTNYDNWRDHPGLTEKRKEVLEVVDNYTPKSVEELRKMLLKNLIAQSSNAEDPETSK